MDAGVNDGTKAWASPPNLAADAAGPAQTAQPAQNFEIINRYGNGLTPGEP
jgi:hypothetical protein